MPRLREISPAETNTEPRELELPSPTCTLEEGERGLSPAETITDPKRKMVGSIYDEIPEYEGTYLATENGTYATAGLEMRTDFVVNVQPKGLTTATFTSNGTYKPEDYDGYSQVEVAIPAYGGSYSITANGTLSTKNKLMTDDLAVNVEPNLTTLTATENKTYTNTC